MKYLYVYDFMGDGIAEAFDISKIILKNTGLKIDIESSEDPNLIEDGNYDVLFFDWGGASIGNSMLEHFCDRILDAARNMPTRLYVMTSTFTRQAMIELMAELKLETEEIPKNLFLSVEDDKFLELLVAWNE